jgi:hypothetical protein
MTSYLSLGASRLLPIGAALMLVAGCSSPQARVKNADEPQLVGADRAGSETYDRLVRDTTRQLLETHSGAKSRETPMVVAFVGVESKGAEELRDFREAMFETIDTELINSARYTNVSRRFVDAALRETNQPVDRLFLADGRDAFMSVLQREGVAPEYLLFAKVTTQSTTGVDERERDYQLTLEMVDALSGVVEAKKTSRVSKNYQR